MTSPFTHPLPVSSPRMAAVAWPGSCCSAADPIGARGFRAIFLARYGDQSARENNHVVNSGGLLTRWSLPRVYLRQKPARGLSNRLFALLGFVALHERNLARSCEHGIERKSASGA